MRYMEPSPEQTAAWNQQVASQPDPVRTIVEKIDPWTLYRLKSTGDRVTLCAFNVDDDRVTLTVAITGQFNLTPFARNVFGIDPDNLDECDLPGADEKLGEFAADPAQINAIYEVIRKYRKETERQSEAADKGEA